MSNNRQLMKGKGVQAPALTILQIDTKTGNGPLVHNLTSVPANALIVVTTANQNSNQNCVVTSSPSYIFNRQVDNPTPNAEIFTTIATFAGNINVTVSWGNNVQTSVCYVITGYENLVSFGANASSQPTASIDITTTKTNSIVFGVSVNWNVVPLPVTYRGTPTQTLSFSQAPDATFVHYYYTFPSIVTGYTAGYSSPVDGDNGTGTALLEVRSSTGVAPPPDTTSPSVVTLTSPSKGVTTIDLSWTTATDNVGVIGYDIYLNNVLNNTTTSTTATLSGLNSNTTYNIYVRPKDAAGNTSTSNTVVVTTNVAPVDTQAPTAPNINQSSTTSNSITINWTASTDNVGVTGYEVYINNSLVNTTTNTTYQFTGLSSSTQYNIYVRAKDAANNGTNSNTVFLTTGPDTDNQAPTAPVLSSPSKTTSSVSLTWTASSDNVGVVGYDVYVNSSFNTTTTNLTYTVGGLSSGTAYNFQVRAKDAAGNTTASNTINVTTNTGGGCPNSFTFSALTTDYSRYWGGSEFWGTGQLAVSGVPQTMHRYRRFTWCDWEGDTQGSYRFNDSCATNGNSLRCFIEAAINNKQLVSFGLITNYPCLDGGNSFHNKSNYGGSYSAYPLYLHNLMQSESTKDWRSFACNGAGHWVPNYNSIHYIARLNALYAALNTYLQTTFYNGVKLAHAVGYIDVRGVGSWGEWHHNATTANNVLNSSNFQGYIQPFDGPAGNDDNPSSNGTFPSWTRVQQIIDAHTDNLNDWPLTTILNSLDGNFSNGSSPYGTGFMNTLIHRRVGQYLMDNGNNWGPIGWRRDQWGDTANYYLLVQNSGPITGVNTRWQTAPVTGEPPGYVANGGGCGCHMGAFPDQATTQHATIVGNSNYGSAPDAQSMRNGFQVTGAIIRPTGGCLSVGPSTMEITLNWRNFGVGTQYKRWNITYELRNGSNATVWSGLSTYDLFRILPSSTTTNITDTLPRPGITGSHRLVVRILDPNGYTLPYQLGIQGRESDGAYFLTNVTL